MARLFFSLCICAVALGCGKTDRPALAPVSGTVTLDGKPLKSGTIVFESDGKRPATGKVSDGQIIEVTTYEPNDGAPVGHHRVAIFSTGDSASAVASSPEAKPGLGKNYMGGSSTLPKRYSSPKTSKLEADVEAGGSVITFPLKSK